MRLRRDLIPRVALALAICLAVSIADAGERSTAKRAAFVREHPCPATGDNRGKCPGWVVDHIVPLCAGGPDLPSNMQWQTIEEAKRKDGHEKMDCRRNAYGPPAKAVPSDASWSRSDSAGIQMPAEVKKPRL